MEEQTINNEKALGNIYLALFFNKLRNYLLCVFAKLTAFC